MQSTGQIHINNTLESLIRRETFQKLAETPDVMHSEKKTYVSTKRLLEKENFFNTSRNGSVHNLKQSSNEKQQN